MFKNEMTCVSVKGRFPERKRLIRALNSQKYITHIMSNLKFTKYPECRNDDKKCYQ